MPYNPERDASAGPISKKHYERLMEMAVHTRRKKRAMLEYLVDQEYERMLKEVQNA